MLAQIKHFFQKWLKKGSHRQEWHNISQMLKENNCQPRIVHLAKMSSIKEK